MTVMIKSTTQKGFKVWASELLWFMAVAVCPNRSTSSIGRVHLVNSNHDIRIHVHRRQRTSDSKTLATKFATIRNPMLIWKGLDASSRAH